MEHSYNKHTYNFGIDPRMKLCNLKFFQAYYQLVDQEATELAEHTTIHFVCQWHIILCKGIVSQPLSLSILS